MEVYVARQPIFNRKKKICGYELLFRDGISNAFPEIEDGDSASSKVLSDSFLTIGIDHITGGKRAFINFTRELLVRKVANLFPREKIMVEVLEDVEPDQEVISACKEIVQNGYKIALDDFTYTTDLKPLIDLAKVIKIDFRLTPKQDIPKYLHKLSGRPIEFLAEKVETNEEFQLASDMGFEYFQGYFFGKPYIIKGKDISPSKMTLLQIMSEINKEDFSYSELEQYVVRDVSISHKLLLYINSAYYKRPVDISTVKQALVFLGKTEIRRFLSLVILTKLSSDKPNELIRSSLIRARFCEQLGRASPLRPNESELFTLGLFSRIDAILGGTMGNLMERLPLTKGIKGVLVEDRGELRGYLKLVSCFETGDWPGVSEVATALAVDEEKIPQFYMDALAWADTCALI